MKQTSKTQIYCALCAIFSVVGISCREPVVQPLAPPKPVAVDTTTKPRTQALFTDVSAMLPSGTQGSTMDVAAADLDGDGDNDLVLAMEFIPNVILINDGAGNFSNESLSRLPQVMRDSEDIALADFDKDGDIDIIFVSEDDILTNRRPTHEYYLNNGKGVFTAAPYRLPDSEANAIAVADLNNDTYPDIVIGNAGQDFVLINDKAGGFIDETEVRMPSLSDITQDVKLADIDNDGDLDMFLGNENGNKILVNNGQGVFSDETQRRLISQFVSLSALETRKVTFQDVDADGDVDVYLSNVAFRQGKNADSRLFLNNGSGIFTDVSPTQLNPNANFTLDGMFLDFDNDGDADLITAGFNPNVPFTMFINNGRGTFQATTDQPFGKAVSGRGISLEIADFNKDGKKDVFFGMFGDVDLLFLSKQN